MQPSLWPRACRLLALGIVTSLILVSCGDRKPPVAVSTAKRAVAPEKKFDQAARDAQVKKKVEVAYSGMELRDPFESVVAARKIEEESLKKQALMTKSPLNRYDVQSFKVIGIIEKTSGNVAMLVAPDGKGYMVEKGASLGTNEGRVIQITAEVVTVEEVRKNYRGDVEKKIIPLQLPKPKEAQADLWDTPGK